MSQTENLATLSLTSRRNRLRAGLALGALLAFAGSASAQPVQQLPPIDVVSSSLTPIDATKVGSSVTVMTGEEIRSSGYTQLSDVMRTFPGMAVSQSGSRGSLTQFRVRGTEANHLLVMIDGVPANAVGDGEFNFADIPLDDIERVELLRGPQSGLYGANAHSGVLTIVTKSGRGLTKPEFSARFEGGTQGSAEASMSARGAAGPAYGALTVTSATTNGFNIARDGFERDGAKRFTATAKAGIDFTPYFNVEGFLRHTRRIAGTDPQNDFPNFSGLTFDRAFDESRYDETLARIEGTLKLFDDRWIQSVKATMARQNVAALSPNGLGPLGLSFNSIGTNEQLAYKSTFLVDSNVAGGEKHRLTFLLDNKQEKFSYFDPTNLFGPDLSFWRDGKARHSTGVGGEYVLDLLATDTVVPVAQRQDFNDPFKDEYTWRYSLSQKLGMTGARLHSSIGRGVTNPNYFELYGFLPSFFIGNPNLQPESSIGWDVGWEQTLWNGRVVVDVTYFNSRLQNEIMTVFLPTFQATAVNLTGTSTREGVESSVKLKPLDWLTLAGTYTFTDARDDKGIQEIRRPRHAASGSATVLFDEGRGKATFNVVYNGKMPDTFFVFPSQTVILAAYTLVGGMISYDVTPWATVYVRAENVFNAHYEEVYSYRAPGAAVYAGLKFKSN
jgi:vitamin B12 transporter